MTDRELIIAAAEKVMGYERLRDFPGGQIMPRHYSWKLKNTALPYCLWDDHCQGLIVFREPDRGVVWNPLESIADAWMLVDKLDPTDLSIEKCGLAWYVNFPEGGARGCADIRRAIVLASLRSCGVDVAAGPAVVTLTGGESDEI